MRIVSRLATILKRTEEARAGLEVVAACRVDVAMVGHALPLAGGIAGRIPIGHAAVVVTPHGVVLTDRRLVGPWRRVAHFEVEELGLAAVDRHLVEHHLGLVFADGTSYSYRAPERDDAEAVADAVNALVAGRSAAP